MTDLTALLFKPFEKFEETVGVASNRTAFVLASIGGALVLRSRLPT